MRYLSDDLPALRAEFAGYRFEIAPAWHGMSLVALRTGAGDGPLVVITADIDELRHCLTATTSTTPRGGRAAPAPECPDG
jgi:hypothetical protein